MANSEAGTSSDVAGAAGAEYQVFLSFRGPDTRYAFTDFLYNDLVEVGLRVFRDNEELRAGDVIEESLLCAINSSTIYIPVFSVTYAESKWCLRELAHIIDNVSKSEGQKSVVPIFFDVEPKDVGLWTPLYSNALLKHEERYPNEVGKWKAALKEVSKISGFNVGNNQSQAAIAEEVVEEVLKKLRKKQKSVPESLIGLDDRIKELTDLLKVNDDDVRLIGIYGMGGIGKTTIVKVIFNNLCSHFKCCTFLEGVRESSIKKGIVPLQIKLLSDIGGPSRVGKIEDSEDRVQWIGQRLSSKKVLVVLDDIDRKELINDLIGNSKLYPGSRIIITTREKDILDIGRSEVKIEWYEMPTMKDDLALQLFCQHAFRKDYPSDGYHELSRGIVALVGGLPLAIEVVGSLLKNKKDTEFWKETLAKLKEVPHDKVIEKLRISYDDLSEIHKEIFLDIACFLFNERKTDAIHMWKSCNFCPIDGIDVLTKRCLIKIQNNDEFWMHDQLIALGRQIVRKDSVVDPGEHSRLWIAKEVLRIIKTKKSKDKVQGLQIDGPDNSIEITNEEFERLPNLRLLELRNGTFAGNFDECRSQLKWISWQPPIREFRAKNMYLEDLVVFKLGKNNFEDNSKAWNLIERAKNLKVLSLTDCDRIKTSPNFLLWSNLERLALKMCNKLNSIGNSIGNLQSLIMLEIEWCPCLVNLPEEVGALVKLQRFSLLGCHGLTELPGSLGNLTSLTELDLSGIGVGRLPSSITGLVKLKRLHLIDTMISKIPNSIGMLKSLSILRLSKDGSCSPYGSCSRENYIWELPNDISMLKNLEELDLSGRDEMKGEIPSEIGELSSLKILNLEETHICGIPRTIGTLQYLQTLNLSDCNEIRELPKLPESLTCLLLKSHSLCSLPDLSNLTNLLRLELSDGSSVTKRSNWITGCDLKWIGSLSRLKRLGLDFLDVPAPSELASLSDLEELTLGDLDLEELKQLPSSLLSLELRFCGIRWVELATLLFCYSEVESIPLDGLPHLENLTVDGCKLLHELSIPSNLRKLRQVSVSSCSGLREIQIAGLSRSLEGFSVVGCELLRRINGLSYLKNLERLEIVNCNALTNVEGLNELESLESLKIYVCKSLERLIDASCAIIPGDCVIDIWLCGEFMDSPPNNPSGITLERYREEILQSTSNVEFTSDKRPFTIFLKIKRSSRQFAVKKRKEDVRPDSVTYEGLKDEVKEFGFVLKRIWYNIPSEDREYLLEIKSDEQVKEMVQLASKRGSIHLIVEGGLEILLDEAISRASQRGCTLHVLVFLFCVAFFLFLSLLRGKLDSPGKIRQLVGMRELKPWEDLAECLEGELHQSSLANIEGNEALAVHE